MCNNDFVYHNIKTIWPVLKYNTHYNDVTQAYGFKSGVDIYKWTNPAFKIGLNVGR